MTKMAKVMIFVSCMAVSVVVGKPANNEQLDKATANDVAVNTVVAADQRGVVAAQQGAPKETSAINITGVKTGVDPLSVQFDNAAPTFKPPRAGSMFARFIDDIFQIPISVLTSVAKLITNPFTQHNKTPEAAATK